MVNINSIDIWKNGQIKQATKLVANINDNMKDSATVYYRLLTESGEQLTEGNLYMTGEVYDGWETTEYAYSWIASELNTVVITTTTTTTTTVSE